MAIDTQNEERKEKLKEIIKMKEPLAFIGAGCSKQCGYPSWSELLQLMQDEVVKIYPDLQSKVDILMSEKDKLWIAQELRKLMGEDAFGKFIKKIFEPRKEVKENKFYRNLINIKFQHFLTTNYDSLLEQFSKFLPTNCDRLCWDEEKKVQEFIRNLNRNSTPTDTRYIFYLHGRFDSPTETIILSERDYGKRYKVGNLTSKALWMAAAIKNIIFIGFGFEDFDLLKVFREVNWELGAENEPRHYAIIGLKPQEDGITRQKYLLEKYGIQPVFYEIKIKKGEVCESCKRSLSPDEENHDNLIDLISEIANTTECYIQPSISEDMATSSLDESRKIFEYTKRHIDERKRSQTNV